MKIRLKGWTSEWRNNSDTSNWNILACTFLSVSIFLSLDQHFLIGCPRELLVFYYPIEGTGIFNDVYVLSMEESFCFHSFERNKIIYNDFCHQLNNKWPYTKPLLPSTQQQQPITYHEAKKNSRRRNNSDWRHRRRNSESQLFQQEWRSHVSAHSMTSFQSWRHRLWRCHDNSRRLCRFQPNPFPGTRWRHRSDLGQVFSLISGNENEVGACCLLINNYNPSSSTLSSSIVIIITTANNNFTINSNLQLYHLNHRIPVTNKFSRGRSLEKYGTIWRKLEKRKEIKLEFCPIRGVTLVFQGSKKFNCTPRNDKKKTTRSRIIMLHC